MGHCHHQLGNKTKAMECYQYIVDSFDRPKDIHLVELRLVLYHIITMCLVTVLKVK